MASGEGSKVFSFLMSGALGAVPRVGALSRCFFRARERLAFELVFDFELDFEREELPRFDPPDALLRCSAIYEQTIDA